MLKQALRAMRDRVDARRNAVEFARRLGVDVGPDCRLLGISRATFGSEPFLVRIGSHVTVTAGVRFVTHDGGVWVLRNEYPDLDVLGRITVGDNVFIGINSVVMPNVRIGNNVVIGACSVVTRDVPDNSVAVGSPARVVASLADYRLKALRAGVHIRGLPRDDKKAAILKRFGREEEENDHYT